jgi:hypothetical protein
MMSGRPTSLLVAEVLRAAMSADRDRAIAVRRGSSAGDEPVAGAIGVEAGDSCSLRR